ncbi:MAG: polysaccharide deacetylase family protein [Pseudomonadota bacterium]
MPGMLCLTYDDLFVDQWLSARRLFDAFDARVTFCVARLHEATPEQMTGLKVLQADGHEIGFHTRTHPRLLPYLARHGLEHWLKHEIDDGIEEHRAAGFPATSFACPYHASTGRMRAACATRFAVIRAAGPRRVDRTNAAQRIYHRPGPSRSVDNIGYGDVQHARFPGWTWHSELLDRIAESGGTGVFTGHGIRPDRDGPGFYTAHNQLRRFLRSATERGLAFQTLTEFATAEEGPLDGRR